MNKRIGYVLIYTIFVFSILAIYNPKTILQEPLLTPIDYLSSIPYWTIRLFSMEWIVIVPSSTFLVYVLGGVTVALGVSFLKQKQSVSQKWWGVSFILWGLGALLAGTSYQGLGYELKCDGYPYCLFTSWFELAYSYTTALSIGTMMIGVGFTMHDQSLREKLMKYAVISTFVYSIILVIGTVLSIKILITYELFTLFFLPHFTSFFMFAISEYKKHGNPLQKQFIQTWILFLIVNVSYFIFYFLDIGNTLYSTAHIWFSANDVLHLALLLWMVYIWVYVKPLFPTE